MKISHTLCHTSIVPGTQGAEAGKSLEPEGEGYSEQRSRHALQSRRQRDSVSKNKKAKNDVQKYN